MGLVFILLGSYFYIFKTESVLDKNLFFFLMLEAFSEGKQLLSQHSVNLDQADCSYSRCFNYGHPEHYQEVQYRNYRLLLDWNFARAQVPKSQNAG